MTRDTEAMTDTTLRRNAAANLNMIGAEIQLTAASSGVVPDDMFTVTQAVNNIGFGRFQIILSFIVGLCWMADSMEMMILSILPLALQCEWGINHYRQAFLTTIVFIGKFDQWIFIFPKRGMGDISLDFVLFCRHDDQFYVLGENIRQIWKKKSPYNIWNISLLLWISLLLCPHLWLDPLPQVHGWFQHRVCSSVCDPVR